MNLLTRKAPKDTDKFINQENGVHSISKGALQTLPWSERRDSSRTARIRYARIYDWSKANTSLFSVCFRAFRGLESTPRAIVPGAGRPMESE
jgi:hypothetical protein